MTRNLVCVLLSVGALLFAHHHQGAAETFLRHHGANLAFSFGAFYLLRLLRVPPGGASWVTALFTLLGVWGQELLQALGVYPGVFDPRDLLYDAIGVLAAWAVSGFVPEGRRPTAER